MPSTGAVEDGGTAANAAVEALRGRFVEEDGESWYRIDGCDAQAPFFMALAGDSDLWAFLSSAGSLAAGRRDAEGAFLPYETVDKVHLRWEHTGPRSWIRVDLGRGTELWQPFAPHCGSGPAPQRSVWKTLCGTRIRFRELHPSGRLVFQQEWCTAADLGLLRSARLWSVGAPVAVQVLDGVLNLLPPNVGTRLASTLSSLTDAYKWNEATAGGRLGLFTLYAQIWDRAEPKESFHALVAWHAGLPEGTRSLLSDHQVQEFCRSGRVQSESLTRGRRGAFLVQFDTEVSAAGCDWHLVIDAPYSQVQAAELARRLAAGFGTPAQIAEARARNWRDWPSCWQAPTACRPPGTRWLRPTTRPTCCSTSCVAVCSSTAPSWTATTCVPLPASATVRSARQ